MWRGSPGSAALWLRDPANEGNLQSEREKHAHIFYFFSSVIISPYRACRGETP
jgi:hypothetical protein